MQKEKSHFRATFLFGAGDRGRTGTILLSRDFKSRASAYSATPAYTSYTDIICACQPINYTFDFAFCQ